MVATVAAAAGCETNYRCTGSAIRCESFQPSFCESVPGCTAGDACIMYASDEATNGCFRNTSQSGCSAPRCEWVSNACQDVCTGIADLQTCNGVHSTEMTTPAVNYVWECAWVHCHGTPVKKVCSDYSTDACPADLGCSVEKANAF